MKPTDFVLVQAKLGAASVPSLAQAFASVVSQSALPLALRRVAWSAELQTVYGYAKLPARTELSALALQPLAQAFQIAIPAAQDIRLSRLQAAMDLQGHSYAQFPVFHYVVEMDPEDGWMPEISRWYDTEHMPGLAAVPGTIRATRLLNHDYGPLSLACYDLVSTETLGSAPWLAVRGTAWSDITRPHFTNTKRSMFTVIA